MGRTTVLTIGHPMGFFAIKTFWKFLADCTTNADRETMYMNAGWLNNTRVIILLEPCHRNNKYT